MTTAPGQDANPSARLTALPRVVVTGMGALSCLGPDCAALLKALRTNRCGIRHLPAFAQLGLHSQVGGPVDLTGLQEPPRKLRRYLSIAALHAWHATNEALAQSALREEHIRTVRCGVIVGGGASLSEHEHALRLWQHKGLGKVSPFVVPRIMGSNLSASLAQAFGSGGHCYTISSACTSAAHAIGHAMELIRLGKQDIVLCGGSEELHPSTALGFDVMGALSHASNDDPAHASRPYDAQRDGFVLAAGAGMLVLESLEHARARGAVVLAELCGYGASTDAGNVVGASPQGMALAMRQALDQAGSAPAYINTQACSTPIGDLAEWQAMQAVFTARGEPVPPFSSIKSLCGHAPSAAAALDAIASVLMMQHDFIAAGLPLLNPDEAFAQAPLLATNSERRVDSALSNSFGFGGSCASLYFRRWPEPPP